MPTACQNKKYGRKCKKEDNFDHLVDCYGLRDRMAKGVNAIDFLLEMAKRTVTDQPGMAAPTYVISEHVQ